MKLTRRLAILAAAALVGGTASYAAGHTAPDLSRRVTESRCRSGEIMYHAGGHDVQPETATSSHPASQALLSGTGFTRPVVSLTFDDGWRSIHDTALPLMRRFDIPSTQYLITGELGRSKAYMTPGDVYDFRAAGHEIASHAVTHADLTAADASSLAFELGRSQQDLGRCYGAAPTDFASPLGATNPAVTDQIKKHYQTDRSTDTGFNTPGNFDAYGLLVQFVTRSTTSAQLEAWLDTARSSNSWLILVYERVDNAPGVTSRTPADFTHDMQAIKASGMATLTVHRAFEELAPQANSNM